MKKDNVNMTLRIGADLPKKNYKNRGSLTLCLMKKKKKKKAKSNIDICETNMT